MLAGLIRASDHLLSSSAATGTETDPVLAFARMHGNDAGSILAESVAPDLIIILVDPMADSESALFARALAPRGNSDLVIAELPDLHR